MRLYNPLFTVPNPADDDPAAVLNPHSLVLRDKARLEEACSATAPWDRFQFERLGYFMRDPVETGDPPVFNRIVALKDGFAKDQKKGEAGAPGPRPDKSGFIDHRNG